MGAIAGWDYPREEVEIQDRYEFAGDEIEYEERYYEGKYRE